MSKREIFLLPFFVIPISLVVMGIHIRFYFIENPDQIIQRKENLVVLIEASKKIKKIWHEGDLRGSLKNKILDCSKEFGKVEGIDSTFFRCNPKFLECFLRESKEKNLIDFPKNVTAQKQKNNKYVEWVSRSLLAGPKIPPYGVMISLGYRGDILKIILEDSCNQSIIPQRVYSYGPEIMDWRWDNLDRFLAIDKNQVTNADILNWRPDFKYMEISHPVLNLKKEDMENFCLSKGMQLVQAQVFDAATYFPGDMKNQIPTKVFKSPYPWTKVKMNSFLFYAQRYADFVFEKKYCSQAYSSECINLIPFEEFQFKATTWLGLSSILGGPMEYMRNPIDPNENLFASSYHFPISSLYHQLGKRAFWDGLGNSWEHFRLEEKPNRESGDVGFRCMRVISNVR